MQVNVKCGSLTLWHFKTDLSRVFISLTMNRFKQRNDLPLFYYQKSYSVIH